MTLQLVHRVDDSVEVEHAGQQLLRYVYQPNTIPAVESPKPYFHPIRTLAGREVTGFRPHDHPWHQGLAMTMTKLSDANFWGGASYVRGEGYKMLDNHGRIHHREWVQLQHRELGVRLQHRLAWIGPAGTTLLDEDRSIEIADCNPDAGHYTLALGFALTNVSGETLEFGSPSTHGRPDAGYGSLFWRGPRCFEHGSIFAAGGLEGASVMGQRAPWLGYRGRYDDGAGEATLVFVDHPDNPRYPTKWFVRSAPIACASYSFMFDEIYALPPGETLNLRYRLLVADGGWSPQRVEDHVATLSAGNRG